MSQRLNVESILHQATEREREYDWLGASKFYTKAFDFAPEQDFSRVGDVYERLGYAF